MARKKKELVVDGHGDVHDVNVPSGGWPKINQGSHLTVKTFEDGSTELVWDDEALMRDVREALASVETKGETNGKIRKTRKSK